MRTATAVSSVTTSTFIVLLIVWGYKSIYDYNEKRRKEIYDAIEKQIKDWLSVTGFPKANYYIVSNDTLRHFQVKANHRFLSSSSDKNFEEKKIFCEKIHYELTHYPTELIYGIHFEFDNTAINSLLYKKFANMIDIKEVYPFLSVDKEIPKRPGWIFLIRKVDLSGDFDKDIALIATHIRHFVELVCHTFSTVYCSDIINAFTSYNHEKHG
jgi:hypothetical protein